MMLVLMFKDDDDLPLITISERHGSLLSSHFRHAKHTYTWSSQSVGQSPAMLKRQAGLACLSSVAPVRALPPHANINFSSTGALFQSSSSSWSFRVASHNIFAWFVCSAIGCTAVRDVSDELIDVSRDFRPLPVEIIPKRQCHAMMWVLCWCNRPNLP